MLTDASRLADFPALGHMTYLNTAAEGIPSPAVGDSFAFAVAISGTRVVVCAPCDETAATKVEFFTMVRGEDA